MRYEYRTELTNVNATWLGLTHWVMTWASACLFSVGTALVTAVKQARVRARERRENMGAKKGMEGGRTRGTACRKKMLRLAIYISVIIMVEIFDGWWRGLMSLMSFGPSRYPEGFPRIWHNERVCTSHVMQGLLTPLEELRWGTSRGRRLSLSYDGDSEWYGLNLGHQELIKEPDGTIPTLLSTNRALCADYILSQRVRWHLECTWEARTSMNPGRDCTVCGGCNVLPQETTPNPHYIKCKKIFTSFQSLCRSPAIKKIGTNNAPSLASPVITMKKKIVLPRGSSPGIRA